MLSLEELFAEIFRIHNLLPASVEVAVVAMYILIGAIYWSRCILQWELEEGLDDHLVHAERLGTRSAGETVALLLVKLAFYLLWPLYAVLMYGCRLIGLLRFGTFRTAV